MKKQITVMAAIACAWSVTLQADPISIFNASFEDPPLGDIISGWNEIDGNTNFTDRIGNEVTYLPKYPGGAPDGTHDAYIYTFGGTIWQQTSKLLEPKDLSYKLSAYLGRRLGEESPDTTFELRAGDAYTNSTLLGSLLIPSDTVTDGTFEQFTLTWDRSNPNFASLLSAHLGENVIVAFSVPITSFASPESDFDLVELSYVPEPTSVCLVGLGSLLLTLRRRAKQS